MSKKSSKFDATGDGRLAHCPGIGALTTALMCYSRTYKPSLHDIPPGCCFA
jgi:hypothetical protein